MRELLGFWSVATVLLIGLVIHRSILGFREEQSLFDEGEGSILQREHADASEQGSVLDSTITGVAWMSGLLLLAAAFVWLYPGIAGLFGR